MSRFQFSIDNSGTGDKSNARAANLKFSNGMEVPTPVFMPVGTQASVKSLWQEDLEEIGYNLILTNTYHLYIRPGTELLKQFNGVKNFMSWPHLMLTDSGGYQAFSLSGLTKYDDGGVHFKSHLDGSSHYFTPENVLDTQAVIGSDIVMPLDDCAPYPADETRLTESLKRTHEWMQRSVDHWNKMNYNEKQSLFAIVQGGVDLKKREESALTLSALDVPGFAIGGLSVGEKNEDFLRALQVCTENLPKDKPRYLMGVGSIPEIIKAVDMGVDMFDCVLPTRNARNGQVFTSAGKINLRAEYNKLKDTPIDPECKCSVCARYSLGYLRHLHKAKEISAYSLSSYHNLYFMKKLMTDLRQSIVNDSFLSFKKHWIDLFSR